MYVIQQFVAINITYVWPFLIIKISYAERQILPE